MSQAGSEPTEVECYSGYTFAQEPRTFTWEGRRYEVRSVVRRWRTPGGRSFLVTAVVEGGDVITAAEDLESAVDADHHTGRRWQLTYNEVQDQWHTRRVALDGEVDEKRTGS